MPSDIEAVLRIIRIFLIIAGICTTIFPILYAFSPWYRTHLGRAVMVQSLSIAFAIDISLVFQFMERQPNLKAALVINIVILGFIALAACYLSAIQIYYNFLQKQENQDMEHADMPINKPFLTDTLYNRAKWFTQIGLPALGTLYFTVAQIYGLPAATEVVGTIVAVDTFLGVLLGLSTKNYNESEAKFDGVMQVEDTPLKLNYNLVLNGEPEELAGKDQVIFKVEAPPTGTL